LEKGLALWARVLPLPMVILVRILVHFYAPEVANMSLASIEPRLKGESDSLTKTKHSEWDTISTECEFCPVLWLSRWGDSLKRGLTAGVTMTLST